MNYSGQSNKWFSVLILAGLPFWIIYRWLKNDLPHIEREPGKPKNISG
ncbi:MAG: hypothetical protein HY764_01995 [Candidatus Portnoybacteria bacterium]|nr:hypothetical protein [Candidatus Portnoybacteria bacterium]